MNFLCYFFYHLTREHRFPMYANEGFEFHAHVSIPLQWTSECQKSCSRILKKKFDGAWLAWHIAWNRYPSQGCFELLHPVDKKKDYNIHERQKKRIFVMWVGSRSSEWTTFKVGGSYIFRVFHKCSAYTIIWNFSSTASLFDITAFNEQKWTNDRRRFAAKFLMWIFTSVQQVISSAPSPCDCASHFIIAFEMCRECQWQTEEKNFVCVPRAPFKCSPHEPSLKKFCKLCEYNK